MRIVIATVQVPFVQGGAEILAENLRAAIAARGHAVEIVAFPHQDAAAGDIMGGILACRLLNVTETLAGPVDRLIGMKFPAYLIRHPHKVLWLMHQYRGAYDLWDTDLGSNQAPDGRQRRAMVMRADAQALAESRATFTISQNVSRRLQRFNGVASTHLYPPPAGSERFSCGQAEDYFFFPSRLSALKRQQLVIQALALCRRDVRVRMAGAPDSPEYAEQTMRLAGELGVTDRVAWLGALSSADLLDHYAHARAVLYPPLDEDYGFVTLEAMLSSKAVITCADSGGTLEFVLPDETGVVAEPTPVALAAAMDELWAAPVRARRMGEAGRARYDSLDISWTTIVDRLLA